MGRNPQAACYNIHSLMKYFRLLPTIILRAFMISQYVENLKLMRVKENSCSSGHRGAVSVAASDAAHTLRRFYMTYFRFNLRRALS